MPKTTLVFEATDRQARQAFDRLQEELKQTSRETDRTNRTFRDADGRLRNMQGRFTAAGRDVGQFTQSLGGARALLTGLGAAVAAREIFEFGAASVRAAGQMEGMLRGLEAIEGENATERLRAFNEIAKLPGLNTPQIIRYSNSLRAAGATAQEVDQIIISFGQSIVGLGGSAADTSRAMLQLTQAFGENRISQENFSTIKELIPSFNRLSQEVYNTDGSMDDLNKTFQASGQTLGQFLLPILARLREEIPAAPVDSYARSVDALAEEFQQFKIAIGTELLPVVASTARGLASLFDSMTQGVQVVSDFFDIVDEEHEALLNASESAREFSLRLADIDTALGQSEAVNLRIQTLHRLRTALRIEQSQLSDSSQEYLQYAERIRDVANELDFLRAIRAAGTDNADNANLLNQQSEALERANAEIQRYETALVRARDEAVGQTNPSIQQLERLLAGQQQTAATLKREIDLLTDGFQDISPAVETAAADLTNYGLALARLKAEAEDAYQTLSDTAIFSPQLTPNFQSAIAASNAYYAERIRQAETALEQEKQGTEEYNTLETRIFNLRRQRLQEETRLRETLSQIRIERTRQVQLAEQNALQGTAAAYREYRQILNSVLELQRGADFRTYIDSLRQQGLSFQQIIPHAREYLEFLRQLNEIPARESPEGQYEAFRSEIQRTTESGNELLSVLRQIAREAGARFDLDARIPDPGVRQQQIDEQLAIQNAQGGRTLGDIQIEAYQEGAAFIRNLRQQENTAAERELQASLRRQARSYRQFSNLVSNTFVNLATGRAESFEQVATAFIQQSLRIVLRAYVEFQIQKNLDNTLTASKIANINKIAAAQQSAGLAGNLSSVGNIPGIGSLLSGVGLPIAVTAALFSSESSNLLSGIRGEISGFLDNIGGQQQPAVIENRLSLQIGENQARELREVQDTLVEEDRL